MKPFLRVLYSLLLMGAGVLHFLREEKFRSIVPEILPARKAIVLVTGVFEIMFSVLLWVRKGQHITGRLLALFMIVVFPANIYMAVKRIPLDAGREISPWILWLRVPLQVPLIVGALTLGRTEK